MVKKFSVGIPDELAERLEPFRDKISPTAVFQCAIADAVDREEALQKARAEYLPDQKGMDAIVQRLKVEKENRGKAFYEAGEKEGVAFARVAKYEELKDIIRRIKDEEYDQWVVDISEELFNGFAKTNKLVRYFEERLFDFKYEGAFIREQWLYGWLNGVKIFWNKLPADLRS